MFFQMRLVEIYTEDPKEQPYMGSYLPIWYLIYLKVYLIQLKVCVFPVSQQSLPPW